MAQTSVDTSRVDSSKALPAPVGLWRGVQSLLRPLASLKLTIVLLACAIFIVFAGTLAQTDKDVWVVVDEYFRTILVWIDFQVFFPKAFFPGLGDIPGVFPFPGGWLIGAAMAVNLLAAHLSRFTMQARGARLLGGLAVLAFGVVLTVLVILGGSHDGLQGEPLVDWRTLWLFCKLALAATGMAAVAAGVFLNPVHGARRRALVVAGALVEALAVFLFGLGERAALGDASMRILWQLIQGGIAGLVLQAGCWMVFGKRGGIVLLHSGIGLLMFSEILVGMQAVESQIHIKEGETINYAQDIRTVELAIVDRTDADRETVVVIPEWILKSPFEQLEHAFLPRSVCRKVPVALREVIGCRAGNPLISHPELPFDLRIVKFLKNSRFEIIKTEADQRENPATAGFGQHVIAREVPAASGVKSEEDSSAIYVELLRKGTAESLGVRLLSLAQTRMQESRERAGWSDDDVRAQAPPFQYLLSREERVAVDGRSIDLYLRYKRTYKPYSIRLEDVRADMYLGTRTPRNYSSDVVLMDASTGVTVPRHIWMNNPLRYGGETFYQSNYMRDPLTLEEATGLQVVANTGWMIPYVSCMIVGVGMLFQFVLTLSRFVVRVSEGRGPASPAAPHAPAPGAPRGAAPPHPPVSQALVALAAPHPRDRTVHLATALAMLFCLVVVAYQARVPGPDRDGFNLYEAGKIPIVYEGRVKPLDTLARNSLQILSNYETFTDTAGRRQSAMRWLLDVMARPREAGKHKVIRVDDLELLEFLKLPRRKNHLYSSDEIRQHLPEFEAEVSKARDGRRTEDMSRYERKLLELDRRLRALATIERTMVPPELSSLLSDEEATRRIKASRAAVLAQLDEAEQHMKENLPPLVIPVRSAEGSREWQPLVAAVMRDFVVADVLGDRPRDPAVNAWNTLLEAYARKTSAAGFNAAVASYLQALAEDPPQDLDMAKVRFEAYFNHFSPFWLAWVLYIFGFMGTLSGWLLGVTRFHRHVLRAAFWFNVAVFALHTYALVARIYISGRPPITNLYSSAVFIGWGAVIFGLVLEWIFKLGVGNAISAISGYVALLISFKLAKDGDTFTVMQAVLDTQFWLATHVVCITLGYAATFVAGILGMFYVVCGHATPRLTRALARALTSMTYGVLCFAIFFSFVGTVLGGLWADDSWGRFWGWDPKENGALIIVLWNALVLHARWDGLVKERGLAVLAVGGNMVTSWSWFGVNELNVGLHSYGFTEGVLFWLGLANLAFLAVILAGCLPRRFWWSHRAQQAAEPPPGAHSGGAPAAGLAAG